MFRIFLGLDVTCQYLSIFFGVAIGHLGIVGYGMIQNLTIMFIHFLGGNNFKNKHLSANDCRIHQAVSSFCPHEQFRKAWDGLIKGVFPWSCSIKPEGKAHG